MKITVTKDDLRTALGGIANIVDKGSTKPILSHFLLTARGGKTTIRATDLNVGVREPLTATVIEEGQTCPPARKLLEIIKEMDAGDITLESKEPEWLAVSIGKSKFKLACLPPKDFPSWPNMKEEGSFSLKAGEIATMLEQTVFCTGQSDTRYALNGLLFHLTPNQKQLTIVGTDGHRLALMTKDVVAEGDERKLIVPRKAAIELRKFLDEETVITCNFSKNHILFKTGEVDVLGRLIEGSYPNYQAVIPADNDKKVVVEPAALAGSLRKAMILTKEGKRAVSLDISEKKLNISTGSNEVGEATDSLDVEYGGAAFETAFDPGFLLDAAAMFEKSGTEKVTLSFAQPLTPALMTNNGSLDYICLIMPVRK
ncbi:MAG: DNA polymerase III subunit beta [Thermodesulfovibrionales bacterium]